MSPLRTFAKFTCSCSRRVISYIVTNDCGEESLLGKTEWCKATQERQRGGLKGRDLSGLDCVLIEVTCIKWNLIGTDTGSLTDRHDADGLRGGERGSEGDRERKREWVVQSRRGRNRSKWNTPFCYYTWPNGKSFVTPDIKRKPPEPFKQLKRKKEDSAVRLVSRASHDWRLMRHVTLLEEDTHGRDCEWQGTALEFALPLQLPQTFISALLEMKGKKTPVPKKTRGKEAKWQLLENSHLDEGTSKCSTGPPDSLLLLTGDNCFEGPLLSPNLRYLASALNDPFKCYQSNRP